MQKINEFYQTLEVDSNKAVYGEREVRFAYEMSAIKDLLICDKVYNCNNFKKRKMIQNLVKDIKE